MFFCPNCSYLFDISKSLKTQIKDDRIVLNKINDAFIKLEENIDMTKYKAGFLKEDITKNKKYQKFTDENKIKINLLFEEQVSSGAEFKCNNCNYIKLITETTLLYQINTEDKLEKIKTIEENQLLINDPLLPHTHDYTCKNSSCITHKKMELKDSVFIREKNSFKLNYICCVCFHNW
jgi:hypothetical protein